MPGFIAVIVFLFFVVVAVMSKSSKQQPALPSKQPPHPVPPAKPLRTNMTPKSDPPKVPTTLRHDVYDVTGKTENIPAPNGIKLVSPSKAVAPWIHPKITALQDFQQGTREQRSFYFYFRLEFLQDIYLDLNGFTNYAFILLYDLAEEYKTHKDTSRLERQLTQIPLAWPATEETAKTLLLKYVHQQPATPEQMPIATLPNVMPPPLANPTLRTEPPEPSKPIYISDFGQPVYGGPAFGHKYKEEFALTDAEINILNRIYYYSNIFFDHPACEKEILKLFVQLRRRLEQHFTAKNETLDATFDAIADVIARKAFHFRTGSPNYKNALINANIELRDLLIKSCENAIREAWDFKRRLNANGPWNNEQVTQLINETLRPPIEQLLPELVQNCPAPDEATEIYLNAQNTTRWKTRFDELKAGYNPKNSAGFYQNILRLAASNKNNPSVENIFFEASKFIGKKDVPTCLSLYIHYVYYDQQSQKIDDKALGKSILKNNFPTPQLAEAFDQIITIFKTDKNLPAALDAVKGLFEKKRRKIDLNTNRIEHAESAYVHTVDILTNYLDDPENEPEIKKMETDQPAGTPIPTLATDIAAVPPPVDTPAPPADISAPSPISIPGPFTAIQQQLILLFTQNNQTLSTTELDAFAKAHTVFRNQLIDSINEACYETLEDLLIEPEGENYILQETYLKRIVNNEH